MKASRIRRGVLGLALVALAAARADAVDGGAVRRRIAADAGSGVPLVAHVIVALCDNQNQGIVPVPARLGNGQDPASNLYWGAAYGLRSFFPGRAGWHLLDESKPDRGGVLARVVFSTQEIVEGRPRIVYVVGEAWDGRRIREAIERFLSLAAGHDAETVPVHANGRGIELSAGGASHLVAFVGHDGLMDFSIPRAPGAARDAPPRSSMVLACASESYFLDALQAGGSHPLLLTTGLMAPEAYTLDAAVRAWFGGGTTDDVREAAAQAYHRFQACGLTAARRLFAGEP